MRSVLFLLLTTLPAAAEAKSTRLWLAEISAIAAGIEADLLDAPAPLPPPPKPKVPRSQCQECKGTGKVKSGDGIAWVTCDACYVEAKPAAQPTKKLQKYCDPRTGRCYWQ